MAGPADSLRNPIDPTPVMVAWAQATAARNAQSLLARGGPGGPALAPNKAATIKQKHGARVGVETGGMLAGLTAPGVIRPRSAGRYQVLGAPLGKGGTADKINFFVSGKKTIGKGLRKAIKRASKRGGVNVKRITGSKTITKARDFFGHDEAIVQKYADLLGTKALNDLGFA